MSVFDDVGGRDMLMKVSKIFYDKLYKDPWLSQYFKNTKQSVIEEQQVNFLTGALGGPKIYGGRNPKDAHLHILVTEELYQARKKFLLEAIKEAGAPPLLAEKWVKVDEAFKGVMMKKDISECKGRWTTDEILAFPNPDKQRKAS